MKNTEFNLDLTSFESQFVLNQLQIDNYYEDTTSRLRGMYDFIRENHNSLPGDILEFGTFNGSTLLAIGLLLKSLGSKKKVYGFDSFSGFPSYSKEDSLEMFDNYQFSDVNNLLNIKQFLEAQNLTSLSNNTSNFNNVDLDLLLRKIELLNLDNVVLVKGDFEQSIPSFFESNSMEVFASNIDCDLYAGYRIALNGLKDNLIVGGYIHLDEYYSLRYPGARIATEEFLTSERNFKLNEVISRRGEYKRYFLTKE